MPFITVNSCVYWQNRRRPECFFACDSNAKEIDVFVELNGYIHPLEIKKSASPNRKEVKKYELLDKASIPRGNGGIVCMCDKPMPIDEKNAFIPSNLI